MIILLIIWKRNAELYNGSVVYIIVKILILITLFSYLIDTSKNINFSVDIYRFNICLYDLNFLSYANNKINKKVDSKGILNKDSLISDYLVYFYNLYYSFISNKKYKYNFKIRTK